MKFLSKNADSNILKQGLTYLRGSAENNATLRNLLLLEQKNFCAYTEKYIVNLDSVEVEHFNSSIKYNDDYYNYYAVLRRANLYKKDEQYIGDTFFDSLFFKLILKAGFSSYPRIWYTKKQIQMTLKPGIL